MKALNPEYSLIATGSIEEYRVVDGPELRAEGKQPTSPWSYPTRGFAAWGWREKTQVVLPYVPAINTYYKGMKKIWAEFGVPSPTLRLEPVWVEDPLIGERDALDYMILTETDDVVAQLYPKASHFSVTPHAYTPELASWKSVLEEEFGLGIDVVMEPKPYDFPNPFDRSGFMDFANKYDLPIPISKVATTKPDLVEAYQEIAEISKDPKVWAKLAATGGGYGVVPVENSQQMGELYDKFEKLGVLTLYGQQIPWEVQANMRKIIACYSWQYHGNQITTPGGVSIQFMDPKDPSSWIGNGYNLPLGQVSEVIKNIQAQTMAAMKAEFGPNNRHMGGFDFATIDVNQPLPKLVLLEHNGARMSDAVLQSEAAKAFGMEKLPFMAIKLGKPNCDVLDFWQFLKAEGLAFNPATKLGIVPFAWLYDSNAGYATVLLGAPDSEQFTKLSNEAQEIIKIKGLAA